LQGSQAHFCSHLQSLLHLHGLADAAQLVPQEADGHAFVQAAPTAQFRPAL
jgi:hypothetical protein